MLAMGAVTAFPLTDIGSVAVIGVILSLAHRWLLRWTSSPAS